MAKFKVTLSRMVEQEATIEVEADDKDAAEDVAMEADLKGVEWKFVAWRAAPDVVSKKTRKVA